MYVYDYCYVMRQAADSNAQRHWLLKDTYNGTRGKGAELLKLYRCAASPIQMQLALMDIVCEPESQTRVKRFTTAFFIVADLPASVTHSQLRMRLSPVMYLKCCVNNVLLT